MATKEKRFAIVTGASTGIGLELARCCAEDGFDLLIVADEERIEDAAAELRSHGGQVDALNADLSTREGVDELVERLQGRPVDALLANAGRGGHGAFLDQDWEDVRSSIDTNVTGTVYLLYEVGRKMRALGRGRILITGSIAGFIPGAFNAVYNATKAYIDSFSIALNEELKGTGITVTCLMPGATETEFFERAGLMDTKLGTQKKMDAAEVAKIGYKAMMDGEADVVAGWKNKLQAAAAQVVPSELLAKQHRAQAEPGTAKS